MNITNFKEFVLPRLKSECEIKRLSNLLGATYKLLSLKSANISIKNVDETNAMRVWHHINITLASWDKLHRQTRHMMKTSKTSFVDYSNQAYNNSADDF